MEVPQTRRIYCIPVNFVQAGTGCMIFLDIDCRNDEINNIYFVVVTGRDLSLRQLSINSIKNPPSLLKRKPRKIFLP
jgi:hypothetical protein